MRRSLTNRISDETLQLPARDFALTFDDGLTVGPADLRAEVLGRDDSHLELLFRSPEADFEVRVQYELPVGKAYLRKRIAVRHTGANSPRLMSADLDDWKGVRRSWSSMKADKLPYGSHPIFCETLWAGVEFVAAFNEYGPEGLTLRSRPGGVPLGPNWLPLHPTVAGVAEPGRVRDAFLQYLEDIRAAPPRFVACYNSWWTLPTVVTQQDNLNLIRTLKEKLFDADGVFFDIVTTDMGWSNPRSVWEIDRTQMPQGFKDIRRIVEGAGGHLGVWMSPSEVYPPVCDYEWFERAGYTVLRRTEKGQQKPFALSLADPKYRSAVTEQLPKLISGNNLFHIKYDGFVAEEAKGHHDLLPGPDSIEPLARYSLELLSVSRKANPDLVTEPTYMNSLANYISPWILKYSDSIWGNAGGDCPPGINPAPDYRESQTNAREWYIFSSLQEFWLPQNAVQYFDIVHCDRATGFPNHAAMAFGRGRFFLSTYLNPTFMDADDWRIYAGLLKWARTNQEILRNTVVLPSRVAIGEPYVYAHWLGGRGILVVRNPSNETRDFSLDLRAARAPKSLSHAVCYTQYPYRRGVAREIQADSVIALKLAPWELLFLEIVPQREIREPVAIGARWYPEAGRTRLIADPGIEDVTWIEPGGSVRTVRLPSRSAPALKGQVVVMSARRLAENEWLAAKLGPVPTSGFEVECDVSIPRGACTGRLLLLVEFPGSNHQPVRCEAVVNGQPAALGESSSDNHIGYRIEDPQWKDIRQFESHWTWYGCSLPAGPSRVRFSGACGFERPKVGVWLWLEQRLEGFAHLLESANSTPALPPYQDEMERDGICLRPSSEIL
ncbi:MAG: hypothetical protein ABSC08_00240 [Bryobacteraceae bacterium]